MLVTAMLSEIRVELKIHTRSTVALTAAEPMLKRQKNQLVLRYVIHHVIVWCTRLAYGIWQ